MDWRFRLNTLRPRQNGRHFADDIFKCIFLNENVWISIKISLKFVPKGPINNIPALVQIMAWRRPGDKPLSEPMMVNLPTHICVSRPQWVNWTAYSNNMRITIFGVWRYRIQLFIYPLHVHINYIALYITTGSQTNLHSITVHHNICWTNVQYIIRKKYF